MWWVYHKKISSLVKQKSLFMFFNFIQIKTLCKYFSRNSLQQWTVKRFLNDCFVNFIIISFSDCRKTCLRPLIGRGTLNNNTCTCSCSFGMGPNCDGNSLIQYLYAIRIWHHNDTWYVHYHKAVRIVDLFMCKSNHNPVILNIWIWKVSEICNTLPNAIISQQPRVSKQT